MNAAPWHPLGPLHVVGILFLSLWGQGQLLLVYTHHSSFSPDCSHFGSWSLEHKETSLLHVDSRVCPWNGPGDGVGSSPGPRDPQSPDGQGAELVSVETGLHSGHLVQIVGWDVCSPPPLCRASPKAHGAAGAPGPLWCGRLRPPICGSTAPWPRPTPSVPSSPSLPSAPSLPSTSPGKAGGRSCPGRLPLPPSRGLLCPPGEGQTDTCSPALPASGLALTHLLHALPLQPAIWGSWPSFQALPAFPTPVCMGCV